MRFTVGKICTQGYYVLNSESINYYIIWILRILDKITF